MKPQNTDGAQPRTSPRWTVRSVLQWTSDFFHERGIPSSRLNAEVLLAHVLEKDRLGLYLQYEAEVPREALARLRTLVKRRAGREPLQYITGVQEFWSLSFEVNTSTLIPRPETEHLIEIALRYIVTSWTSKGSEHARILDVGTGCGTIAIALAKELPSAWILATDLSGAALAVARRNALRLVPSRTVRFVRADLFEALHAQRGWFHMIVSNPPYVARPELERLEPEVRDHEPRMALDGGPDGLDVLRRIVRGAPGVLCGGGHLVVEIGDGQAAALGAEIEKTGRYSSWEIHPDFSARERVLVARKADGPGA